MTRRSSQQSTTRTGTILLVDDQPEQIKVIRAALDPQFLVKVAIRGEQVLPIALAGDIDLILLDVLMPEMDGYSVCQQLKRHPATCKIPVIFLTCRESQDDESLGLELGAVDFIRKPSSPAVLVARCSNTIAYQRAKEDLRQKNEELRQALHIREDVERMSRHDIKGPLSAILGLPEILLADGTHTEGQQALLKLIEKSGYIILDIVNRSLDLFKMENGTYQLQPEKFDLLEVLTHIVGDLEKRIRAKGIHISLTDAAQGNNMASFFVVGEKMLCYPLFYNLILNAVEASCDQGHISISLATDAGFGIIRMTNPGEVPGAIRSQFFDKYVTFGKADGTGLGTYSAWLAAKSQGGRIELDTSQPGETSVTVLLPKEGTVPPRASTADHWPTGPALPTSKQPAGLRILLVDDVQDNRLVVVAFLDNTPHQVVEATSGEEAIALFAAGSFDLVLMDIMMPGMDGIETTRRIREMEAARGTPRATVVALTANTTKEDMDRELAAGCDRHLSKPLRRSSLLEVIDQTAEQENVTATPVATPAVVSPNAINGDTLARLKAEAGSGFERVLAMFLRNFPGRLDTLHSAWQMHDQEAFKQAAHKLKGTSATFGAEGFSSLCATLERHVAQGTATETAPDILDQIRKEGARVQQELQAFLPQA
ncbi:MAG: response regulator [Magnetococcales bacterium]|nr:response regulator [Magnetococcales bacterium]